MNTENQNDPYSHLKAAWEDGRRIRYTHEGWKKPSEWLSKDKQPHGFLWEDHPSRYEIEPLPADTAPDPALAGKLSDEKLGEIGAEAASAAMGAIRTSAYLSIHQSAAHCSEDLPARTAFAAAVREAVEAKQADEIARLTAELEIFKKIRDSKLELQAKYDDLQVTMDSVTMNANWSIERMKEAEHKLATIEVRLGEIAALPQKWRSRPAVMSWNPAIDCIFELEAALLPRPTAEAVSKADFERFARGEGYSLAKNAKGEFRDTAAIHGWELWQAARASKEGEK